MFEQRRADAHMSKQGADDRLRLTKAAHMREYRLRTLHREEALLTAGGNFSTTAIARALMHTVSDTRRTSDSPVHCRSNSTRTTN